MYSFRVASTLSKRLVIQPSVNDADVFPLGARFQIDFIDRKIQLYRSDTGNCTVCPSTTYYYEDRPTAFRFIARDNTLPAFTVSDAIFDFEGDVLVWEVPPAHELLWGARAPVNDLEHVVREQLTIRINSAIAHNADLKETIALVPKWAKGVLSGQEWQSIVRGSK